MYGTAIDMPNAIKNHHMIFAEAAQLAKMAGVTEMWLTHYSPSINKPADFLREATYVFRNTTLGLMIMLERNCILINFWK